MGMSASQARFLCLTARKNNVEFEGQQINQQRTTLANESASYYSELCNMSVPIPPNIDDYTKVYYTFNDGAMTNTVTSLLYSKSDDKYHINYLQEWQDDYGVVPASSSLVMKAGSDYSIGDDTLRLMDATAPSTPPSTFPNDEYYNSLKTSSEKFEALKLEAYYVALLREEFGNNEDYYVRYVKNSSTGAYEPYFYAKSQIEQPSAYNDRNLASVPAYTIGSVTKTKEILNKECDVEVDSSGRYVAITFGEITGTRTVQGNNQAEINAYMTNVPEPQQSDYQYWGKTGEHYETSSSTGLSAIFTSASASCYGRATDPTSSLKTVCYKHVLAHIIDLHTDGANNVATSYYPITRDTTLPGKQIKIESTEISYSGINTSAGNKTEQMVEVSDYVTYGKKDGVTGDLPVTPDPTAYADLGLSAETMDNLSKKYLEDGSANNAQKLMSNYKINASGDIVKKTILEKAIDLFYLCDHYSDSDIGITDYDNIVMPLIKTFQYDMMNIESTLVDDYGWLPDVEKYNTEHQKWVDGIPAYQTYPMEVPYTEPEKVYSLVVNTITDEEAYNQAMNDYNYQISQYDHKIQEINSKLEIIQQQDKQLELKIKQLDTEENAINTEMDAVKKVISKNVDSSYKTFSA